MTPNNIAKLKELCSNLRFEANIARQVGEEHKKLGDKDNFLQYSACLNKAITYEDIATCIEDNALKGA